MAGSGPIYGLGSETVNLLDPGAGGVRFGGVFLAPPAKKRTAAAPSCVVICMFPMFLFFASLPIYIPVKTHEAARTSRSVSRLSLLLLLLALL